MRLSSVNAHADYFRDSTRLKLILAFFFNFACVRLWFSYLRIYDFFHCNSSRTSVECIELQHLKNYCKNE